MPYYPSWLKGVVYLTANASGLTENAGLISVSRGEVRLLDLDGLARRAR